MGLLAVLGCGFKQQELLGQVGTLLSLSSPAPSWLVLLGSTSSALMWQTACRNGKATLLACGSCPEIRVSSLCCGALWNQLLFSQPGCAVWVRAFGGSNCAKSYLEIFYNLCQMFLGIILKNVLADDLGEHSGHHGGLGDVLDLRIFWEDGCLCAFHPYSL